MLIAARFVIACRPAIAAQPGPHAAVIGRHMATARRLAPSCADPRGGKADQTMNMHKTWVFALPVPGGAARRPVHALLLEWPGDCAGACSRGLKSRWLLYQSRNGIHDPGTQ